MGNGVEVGTFTAALQILLPSLEHQLLLKTVRERETLPSYVGIAWIQCLSPPPTVNTQGPSLGEVLQCGMRSLSAKSCSLRN